MSNTDWEDKNNTFSIIQICGKWEQKLELDQKKYLDNHNSVIGTCLVVLCHNAVCIIKLLLSVKRVSNVYYGHQATATLFFFFF